MILGIKDGNFKMSNWREIQFAEPNSIIVLFERNTNPDSLLTNSSVIYLSWNKKLITTHNDITMLQINLNEVEWGRRSWNEHLLFKDQYSTKSWHQLN